MTKVNNLHSNASTQSVQQQRGAQKKKMGTVFGEDGTLTRAEKRELRKNDGIDLSRSEIRKYSQMEGGEAFLDKYINAEGDDIQTVRKEMALKFFIGDEPYNDVSNDIKADLKRFGVNNEEVSSYLALNRLNAQRPLATINADIADTLNGSPSSQQVRILPTKDDDGNIKTILLYEGEDGLKNEDAKSTRMLTAEDGLFVDSKKEHYYRFNAEKNVLSDVTTIVKAREMAEASRESALKSNQDKAENPKTEEKPKFSEIFAENKTVNIDETGSKQRLTGSSQWATNLVVPRNAEYNESGFPSQIAIELPSDYGSKGSDGVGQKRYQVLNLIDAENNIYSDKSGIRKFQMEVTEDGIQLKQHEIDDSKVKGFLDKNTTVVQQKALENGLNAEQNKMQISAQEESQQIMTQLADRNTSWETYTQIGTDVGRITGAHGLLEKLVDEQGVTGIKTFNDLKPAIDGLMARVPESVTTTPEYQAVQDAIKTLEENPDADIKHSWYNQIFGDTAIRTLDRALMNLARTQLGGTLQGANHANNSYLVGGNGSVVISPDREKGIWNTDAKFNIGGQDYYLYQERALIDRTVDFQDVVEHKDDGGRDHLSLIRNEVTGNNRHGEIRFSAKRAEAETFYFKADGSNVKIPVTVEDYVAYLTGTDGTKVSVEDVLNGRAKMPD